MAAPSAVWLQVPVTLCDHRPGLLLLARFLVRYCARPPLAFERLEPLADGRLLYRFKRPWRNGTTHIVLAPHDLLEKLAALVPRPKNHLVRYHGILAPASKWRASIVPTAAPDGESDLVSHPGCTSPSSSPRNASTVADSYSFPADPHLRYYRAPIESGSSANPSPCWTRRR